MKHLLGPISDYFTTLPPQIKVTDWRFYLAANFANTLGIGAHLMWMVTFFYLDIPDLAWTNLLSGCILATNLYLNRKQLLVLAGILGIMVVIGQYSMATVYLGIEAQFHAYLLILSLFPLIMPRGYYLTKGILFLVCLVSFVLLDVCYAEATPLVVLDPTSLRTLRLFNYAFSFTMLGMWGIFFNYAMDKTEAQLQEKYQEAEDLLHNILPIPIAQRLRDDPHTIAEKYAEVSVLFADLVGFTEMSSNIGPVNLVNLLNNIFSRFDDLVERHGMEKIKTIGDAYMAVAGLPHPASDHATRAADMALDMLHEVEAFNQEVGTQLQIRVGISSGVVVAGVIGKKKFSYDLWGDTVNIASRMESQGVPGKIQVSEATWRLLEKGYEMEARGEMDIKGKGAMLVWLLNHKK